MAVYFIQSGDAGNIKIGTTSGDPRLRLGSLQTGNPEKLRLLVAVPGGVRVEHSLHARFASARVTGEWFEPTKELVSFVETLVWADHNAKEDAARERITPDLCRELNKDIIDYVRGYAEVRVNREFTIRLISRMHFAKHMGKPVSFDDIRALESYRRKLASLDVAGAEDDYFSRGVALGVTDCRLGESIQSIDATLAAFCGDAVRDAIKDPR